MSLKKFIINDIPYKWTVTKDHPTKWLNGQDELTINFVRFNLIINFLKKFFLGRYKLKILDIGIYPGITPKILNKYFPKKENISKFYGLGIGFHEEFKYEMKKINVDLLEADLDPRISTKKISKKIEIKDEEMDLVIFTDVIEHFYDPFYALKEINRVMKKNAKMILTTDNISRYYSLISILKGNSNNTPILSSNIFYNGDWRPHFREYSKNELFNLFKWSGFKVLEHKYYEAEFGMYFKDKNSLIKKDFRKFSFKGKVSDLIRRCLIKVNPKFRDNQICIVEKIQNISEIEKNIPKLTENIDEWHLQRKNFQD